MKKQLMAMMLAGLAATTVFANGDNNMQTGNQSAPAMQAQPQAGMDTQNGMNQTSPAMSGMGAQQDNSGSQD